MFKREAFLIFKHYKESGSIEFCGYILGSSGLISCSKIPLVARQILFRLFGITPQSTY